MAIFGEGFDYTLLRFNSVNREKKIAISEISTKIVINRSVRITKKAKSNREPVNGKKGFSHSLT
jgi:hypothetical protein